MHVCSFLAHTFPLATRPTTSNIQNNYFSLTTLWHVHTQVCLFECLRLLADTQKSAINIDTALTTLSNTLTHLPTSLLSTSDCVQALTISWAKTKEFVDTQIKGTSSLSGITTLTVELLSRTIVDTAQSLPDSVKILYLERELKAGKTWWVLSVV